MASSSTTARNFFVRRGTGNNWPRVVAADDVASNEETIDGSVVELPDNHNNIASPDGFETGISTNSYCPRPVSNTEKYSEPRDSLDLLYGPESSASSIQSNSAVDVIAVHGLNGSATGTWMHPNGKLWLKDFLPTALPGARIFTYGYDAKIRSDSASLIRDHATKLLALIDSIRTDTEEQRRPIIFVAHSLGGLVVKKAIIIAATNSSSYHKIWESVCACMFFGTPHRGSSKANFALNLVSFIPSIALNLRPKLLALLSEDSDTLNDIAESFQSDAAELDIVTCYEQRPMKLWGMIVPKQSAILGVPRENLISMERDHKWLCRFQHDEESDYKVVREQLGNMAKRATSKLDAGKRAPVSPSSRKDLNELLSAMGNLGGSSLNDDVPPYTKGTCEWFVEQNEFKAWLSSEKSELLWVTGNLGRGKTVLSSFIKDRLTRLHARDPNSCNAVNICYFSCDDRFNRSKTDITILNSIMYQILFKRNDLADYAIREWQKPGLRPVENFARLWKVFMETVMDARAGTTFIIIDSIDECEKTMQRTYIDLFSKLSDTNNETPSNNTTTSKVKILCTRKPITDKKCNSVIRLESYDTLEKVACDVNTVIRQQTIEVIQELQCPQEYQPHLEEKLRKHADRLFLWVTLVVRTLLLSSKTSLKELNSIVEMIPENFSDYYRKILIEIEGIKRGDAARMLKIVCGALKPLNLTELDVAMAISVGKKNLSAVKEDLNSNMERYVRMTLGPLIRITDEQIYFAHGSVTTFLENDPNLPEFAACKPKTVHAEMATICAKYLSLLYPEEENRSSVDSLSVTSPASDQGYIGLHQLVGLDEDFLVGERHVFFDYCALNWAAHASNAGESLTHNHELIELVILICSKGSRVLSAWLRSYWSSFGYGQERLEDFDPLVVASYFGLEVMFHHLLKKGLVDIGQSGPVAIYFAAMAGKTRMVELLMDAAVPLNFRGYREWTPLMHAAAVGHPDVVAHLLSGRNEINAVNSSGRTALSLAAGNGHLEVCKLLFDCPGVEVNAGDPSFTPLLCWTKCGDLDILRLLLSKKQININQQDARGRTTLSYAAEYGDQEGIKVLLSTAPKPADAELKDKDGRSPILYAAEKGNLEVIRVLDKVGRINLNSVSNAGFNAVIEASKHHQIAVLEYLKERCPDGFKAHDCMIADCFKPHDTARRRAHDGRCMGTNVLGFAFIDNSPRQLATIKFLVDSKLVDLEEKDTGNEIPIFKAVTSSNVEGTEYLIKRGANVNAVDPSGRTPLHAVAGVGQDIRMVESLVKHGAAVNATDMKGQTPLHAVAYVVRPLSLASEPLRKAPNKTPTIQIVECLVGNGANVDANDGRGSTPLHIAAGESRNIEIVKCLIEKGAHVNATDGRGSTPLHNAAGDSRDVQIVKYLLDNTNANPHLENKDCQTPSMYAEAKGEKSKKSAIIAALIQKTAELKKAS